MREFEIAIEENEQEEEAEVYSEFKLVDKNKAGEIVGERILRAYRPTTGQLILLMALTGRGQTENQRIATVVGVILGTLRGDDRDYFESRLMSGERHEQIPPKAIDKIFTGLMEEWTARPTESPSDSAPSQSSDGPKSTPSTTSETTSLDSLPLGS